MEQISNKKKCQNTNYLIVLDIDLISYVHYVC